jgi:hypothetical protein
MSLRWLSATIGVKFRPGIRRKMAPEARRDLSVEIDAHVLSLEHVWLKNVVQEPGRIVQPEISVIAWVDPGTRSEVAAWLADAGTATAGSDVRRPTVRTDWLFFPLAPEAILIGVVEGAGTSFRFNIRFAADPYRRHLDALSRIGRLGLVAEPLRLGPERQLESPCAFVAVPTGPLRDFLREIPSLPVV